MRLDQARKAAMGFFTPARPRLPYLLGTAATLKQRENKKGSRDDSLRLPFLFFSTLAALLHLFLRGGRKQAVHTQVHRQPSVVIREISDDREGCSKTRDLFATEKRDHFGQIGVRHFRELLSAIVHGRF